MITTYTWTFNPLEHEDLDSLTKVVKIIHRQVRGSDGKRNSGTDYTNTLNIVDGNVGIGTISTEIVIEEADQSSNNKKISHLHEWRRLSRSVYKRCFVWNSGHHQSKSRL